jgi:membrane-bound lytic murein transglycosylase D
MKRSAIFFSLVFLCTYSMYAQVSAENNADKDKNNITVIKIKDSTHIPKGAKIIRYKDPNAIDSSRFVKRVVNDGRVYPSRIKGVTVDPAFYGEHTDYIKKYVNSYHQNHAARLTRMQRQHRKHFSFIENVFKRSNVPKELKALAVIESAMRFDALSPVGARGPWQFMPETGRLLGLRVDTKVDERTDFYKSTKAAAQYLKRLNNMFDGDWLLTVAGYNWGPGNITKTINRSKGKSFWDIKDKLPRETRNHVMAFIATASFLDPNSNILDMGNYPIGSKAPRANFGAFNDAYNDNPTVEDNVIRFEKDQPKIAPAEKNEIATLKVRGFYNIGIIAEYLEEDPTRLYRWNPKFDTDIINATAPVYLRIPIDKLDRFIINKEKIVRKSKLYIDGYLSNQK